MTASKQDNKATSDRHFVQVPMPDWMFKAWSDYAEDTAQERKQVIEGFIDSYLSDKERYEKESDRYVILYASPAKSKPRSLWISEIHYEKVENFANAHSNRSNRVIFTACLEGLIHKGRIKI